MLLNQNGTERGSVHTSADKIMVFSESLSLSSPSFNAICCREPVEAATDELPLLRLRDDHIMNGQVHGSPFG